ncbi:uncharacterized protein LOC106154881 [Lingula anatina]|uniref:Uncharacterized protein LOC106154881 n=1 Tax=Lingula anatina TaxID=7574 RepID=A0A1S3HFL7_LINAN|nr:uncharacterized protein LOC106154881 [Lingula anatina]|eukprot:XP_013384872.1 uncharacterized protein LOC106154881 [Lingula anatina]
MTSTKDSTPAMEAIELEVPPGKDAHRQEDPGSPAINPLLDDSHENSKGDDGHLKNGIEIKENEKGNFKETGDVKKNGSVEFKDITEHFEESKEKSSYKKRTRRCDACRTSCYNFCKPCMTKYHPPVTTRAQRMRHALMCPPHGKLGRVVTSKLTLILLWAVLWAITRDEALPGGNFFGLIVLFLACKLGGFLVSKIRLPPLLGMLIVGCLLRNVPYIDVAKDIKKEWSSSIRSIALVVILIKAALGLDPKALRRLSHVVARLAFIPCAFEAVSGAVSGHFLLGFPWDWSFMLGFVMSAVSPAVVVPSMLHLQEQGLGVDKGIPTAAVASGSVENVVAISAFGVVLGIAFSKGDLAFSIIRGPLEALTGVVYGVIGGLMCWYLPHIKHRKQVSFRTFLVTSGGLFALFGSGAAKFPGAGALGCLTMAFVASLGWRRQGWTSSNPVAKSIGKMWLIFQPLLFGLIGAEIDITKLNGGTVGIGMGVLGIGLAVRFVGCVLAVVRTDFNFKERLFVPIAWLPKATVQAAIGSVALDTARRNNASEEEEAMGNTILTLAVLAILVTAPIGAALIALTAPRLLHQSPKEGEEEEDTKKEKNEPEDKTEEKENEEEEEEEEEEETPESEVESDEEEEEEELEKVEHLLEEAIHEYDIHHPHLHPHHVHHTGDHTHHEEHAHHHHHHHHHHHQDEEHHPDPGDKEDPETGNQKPVPEPNPESKSQGETSLSDPSSQGSKKDGDDAKTMERNSTKVETVNEKAPLQNGADKEGKNHDKLKASETQISPFPIAHQDVKGSDGSQKATTDNLCNSQSTFSCSYDEVEHKRKCARLRDCCYQCCEPCMTEAHPLPPNPTRGQRLKYALMCPPHGHNGRYLTLIVSVLLLWGVLWAITGDNALPGGNLFGLLILLICAQLGGNVAELIRLPSLLGMLLVGVALKNIPYISFARDIDRHWSVAIRSIALAVILLKAALGLDSRALRKSSASVLKLAFLPCLAEAIIEATVAHFLLGFPWDWSFMLGFVLSAVSPAVVVPSMLHLQEQGLGTDKGIPTIAVAAASIENVFVISLFGVLLGIAFSHGQLVQMILQGPLEVLIGVVYGVVVGIVCWYFPHKKHKNLVMYRTFLLSGAGLFALFGSVAAGFPGAGPLGCLISAFTAAVRWRKEECNDIVRISSSETIKLIFQNLTLVYMREVQYWFVLSAVSPAVVVPSMLHLQEQGLGTDKGIPTIAVAAASIENVFVISLFGVLLGIAFSHGQLVQMILQGPLEVLIGVVYGVVVGIVCWYFPHKKHKNLVMYRTFLLSGAGLFALFGSVAAGFPGAGPLGCLISAFTAAVRWRKEECNDILDVGLHARGAVLTRIKEIIAQFWVLFQPFLFGLIGAEVDFKSIEGSALGRTTGLGLAVLGVGLCLRSVVTFLTMIRSPLNMKERLFLVLSWLPKATVQAAIGSIALDTARDHGHGDMKEFWGLQILTIAVLSILVTAPIGAAAIALTSPKLLRKTKTDTEEKKKIIGAEMNDIRSISLEDLQHETNKDHKQN